MSVSSKNNNLKIVSDRIVQLEQKAERVYEEVTDSMVENIVESIAEQVISAEVPFWSAIPDSWKFSHIGSGLLGAIACYYFLSIHNLPMLMGCIGGGVLVSTELAGSDNTGNTEANHPET